MKLQFKKLSKFARTPIKFSKRSAGWDLSSARKISIPVNGTRLIETKGTYGRLATRSKQFSKHNVTVEAGVIDEDYRGNVGVFLKNNSNKNNSNLGDSITIFYCNARSVNNKTDDLLPNTRSNEYSLIAITESWLKPCQNDAEFIDKKYKVFRTDRTDTQIEKEVGGGVLIAIKNEIDSERLVTEEMKGLEAVCIKIPLDERGFLFVYCLYIQPDAQADIYNSHLNAIHSIVCSAYDTLIVFGDWNLPKIKWLTNEDGYGLIPIIGDSQSAKSIIARTMTSNFLESGFSQICDLENNKGNVLDLVLTDAPELAIIEKADLPLISSAKEDKAHVQMVCTFECKPKVYPASTNEKIEFPELDELEEGQTFSENEEENFRKTHGCVEND